MARKILLIDDDAKIRFYLSELFRRWGHAVDTVENPIEARFLLERHTYSVIICDSHFGSIHISGQQFVIEGADLFADAKVILFTGAFLDELEREKLKEHG